MTEKANKKKPSLQKELNHIVIKGAKEHNLKNIDIDIPKKKLVVITGVSGSGKSSLAFDTLFAEGQRRYVESLSAYARQFLGQMEKPKYETIRGLSPTIAIEQKAASKNPRSTVGTITEIYDYLRILMARVGTQFCHLCNKKVGRGDPTSMVSQIWKLPVSTKIIILAPIVENRKGEHREIFAKLVGDGFTRVRIDGVIRELSDIQSLAKNKKHNIEVVVDRLVLKKGKPFRQRLFDSVETALKIGNRQIIIHIPDREDIPMSEERSCCGFAFAKLNPPLFSFNAPLGMCSECNGLGSVVAMDESKVIADKNLSIAEGAVIPWINYFSGGHDGESWSGERFAAMEKQWGIDFDKPWKKLSAKHRNLLLRGSKTKDLTVKWKTGRSQGNWTIGYEGLLNELMRRYKNTKSDSMKTWYQKFMSSSQCKTCQGRRLKSEVLSIRVGGASIVDITEMTIADAVKFVKQLQLSGNKKIIAGELIKEILSRLSFLFNVGLGYLTLDRAGPTLSGGEAQRIRLASQIGSELTGVLYILDEPSIGLHQRDNEKLIETLKHLRNIGNTLLVVEHDQETIEASDWVIDMGPGAGHLGGQVVASGTPKQLCMQKKSLTGQYLSGKKKIFVEGRTRIGKKNHPQIIIKGANENNLQNVDAKFPIGALTCVTGVSGAGKSTLINQILYPALANRLHNSDLQVGEHQKIQGLEHIDKIINIDQKPIGRTPRSNPATYTKAFDLIRDFFAALPESRLRGYAKGRFSFNVKGGRCETCQGDGFIKVEMHFLADVYVPCEICEGKRFNESTLEVLFKGHSIADVLDLSITEAAELFKNNRKILRILTTLLHVGLSYVKVGQAATTLSGGEAQRIKLARELAKRETGRTLYILDEPTTGLHFDDVGKLLGVLSQLVDSGNTIIVIEHNLDVVKTADWIMDIGPEGGHLGGQIVAEGPVDKMIRYKKSHTGRFLAEHLGKSRNKIRTKGSQD